MDSTIDSNLIAALFVFSSDLVGSIPFGLVLTRLAGLDDIRNTGSGNIGATNVLRSGKKGLAAATLILDGGKGWLVVLLSELYLDTNNEHYIELILGFVCVIGHIFPVWLKFRGGKGVATTLGVFLGVDITVGIVSCTVWLISVALFRYSSLAALFALSAAPIYALYTGIYPIMYTSIALFIVSLICHRSNLERLLKGEEAKIGS
jgi:glycerol-3-phosphate acyltransferase PlsY